MKSKLFMLVWLCICVSIVAAQAKKSAAADWHDTTRDVFVNNDIDHGAQVLTADNPTRLVLISSKLDNAIVLDITDKTMSTMAKDAFHFAADHTSAKSDGGIDMQPAGRFTRIDGPLYSFAVGGLPVLIRAHTGYAGELTMDKLWETVPVWHTEEEAYTPDTQAVAALKAIDKDAQVTLLFGTWCGDSKYQIPRLLRALKEAGNDHIHVKLIGIDNQFREPVDTVQPRQLTNVPTIIVERDGHETGRIVETPAIDLIEQDLADVLNGKPNVHKGRWDRTTKIASGVYQYTDASGKACGSENWEMFNTAEGGTLVHSRIEMGDVVTEIFHVSNAQHAPTFAEITRQRGETRARTRISVDEHTLTARVRGSVTGVILQTLEVPAGFNLSSSALAAEGLRLADAKSAEPYKCACYIAPSGFDSALGTITAMNVESKGEESVRVPAGEFRARHFIRKTDRGASHLWLHPQLNVPVRGDLNGMTFTLTALELATPSK